MNNVPAEGDMMELPEAKRAIEEANRKLNRFNSVTRHDILNQLMVLKGFLELALRLEGTDPAMTGYLEKCSRVTDNIDRLITFTRGYQDMGIGGPAWHNIRGIVRKNAEELVPGSVRLTADLPDIEIYADSLLENVFYSVIETALIYGGKTLTEIRFSSSMVNGGMVIVCENDGAGIPPDDRNRLFTRGFKTGSGPGLFLSREILEITGITIAETGAPEKSVRFEILVPAGVLRPAETDGPVVTVG